MTRRLVNESGVATPSNTPPRLDDECADEHLLLGTESDEIWSDPFLLLHKPIGPARTTSAAAAEHRLAPASPEGGVRSTEDGTHVEQQQDPSADLGRRAVHAVAWNGVQLWGYNVVSLAVFVVLGRLLTPSDFGLAASAMVVIWLLRIIVDAGFSRLLVQRANIDRRLVDTAFWTALLLGVLFTALTVATAPALAELFKQPRLVGLIRGLSIIFIFVALDSTPTALLQRDFQWRTLALRRLGATAVSAAVAVWLAASGAGAWALVGQQVVLEGLTVLLLWVVTAWRPSFRFSKAAFGELMSFGGRYSALRVLGYLGANVDNFLIGVFLGPIALGYYVIAYRIFTVLNELLVQTLNNVALPTFSRLQDDKVELNRMFYRATGATALVAFPAYAGLAIAAGNVLAVLFGTKWDASAPVLQLLTVAGVAQAQLAFASSYVISIGLIKRELPWTVAVTAAELVGFAATVHFGITAVAAALAIVLLIAWPVRLLFLRAWGGLSLRRYARSLTPSILATAGMSGLLLPLHLLSPFGPLPTLTLEIAIGSIAYLAIVVLLARSQARALLSLVRRRTPNAVPDA